jgi:hypothetical protein
MTRTRSSNIGNVAAADPRDVRHRLGGDNVVRASHDLAVLPLTVSYFSIFGFVYHFSLALSEGHPFLQALNTLRANPVWTGLSISARTTLVLLPHRDI